MNHKRLGFDATRKKRREKCFLARFPGCSAAHHSLSDDLHDAMEAPMGNNLDENQEKKDAHKQRRRKCLTRKSRDGGILISTIGTFHSVFFTITCVVVGNGLSSRSNNGLVSIAFGRTEGHKARSNVDLTVLNILVQLQDNRPLFLSFPFISLLTNTHARHFNVSGLAQLA